MKRLPTTLPLAATAAVAILLGSSPAAADIVVFRNGVEREGRVTPVDGDPNRISFESNGQVIQLRRDQIAEIIERDEATTFSALGEQYLERRSYPTALRMFQRALRAEPGNARAQAGLDRARAMMEELESERARRQVEANNQDIIAARDQIRAGEFRQAEAALDRIASNTPTAEQRAAVDSVREELYLRWGLSRIDRLDSAGAEAHLQRVLEINPANAAARDALLQVWERNPSRRPNVLQAYQARLSEDPSNIDLNRRVADLLLSMGREAEAVEPLKRVVQSTVLRGDGYGERLRRSLRSASSLAASRGDLAEAIRHQEELLRFFPGEDPTTLVMLQYEERLGRLEGSDFAGRAALIEGVRAQGLERFALREAELLLREDPANPTALAMLRQRAEGDMAEMQRLMARGEFFTVRDMAEAFVSQNARFPELSAQASDMFIRADIEAQRLVQQTREQARNLVTQGDQFLFEARRNAERLASTDFTARTTTISFRQEAILNAERAIQRYQTALRIDPSVGPPMGLDVNTKLADAQRLLASLTATPDRRALPQHRTRLPNTTRN